jgi:hypothetical protein
MKPDIIWDGQIYPDQFGQAEGDLRQQLADAAKNYKWGSLLKILKANPALVNTPRPGGGSSLYTPPHQAAHGGATQKIVEAIIKPGCMEDNAERSWGAANRHCPGTRPSRPTRHLNTDPEAQSSDRCVTQDPVALS